jgi:plastocyanin
MKLIIGMSVLFLGLMLCPESGPANSPVFRIAMDLEAPFYFPPTAQLNHGQSIQWYNRSGMPHTITHDGCVRGRRCVFESGPIPPGRQFTVASLAPGRYPYHCSIHPFMQGLLVISKPSSFPQFSTDL